MVIGANYEQSPSLLDTISTDKIYSNFDMHVYNVLKFNDVFKLKLAYKKYMNIF